MPANNQFTSTWPGVLDPDKDGNDLHEIDVGTFYPIPEELQRVGWPTTVPALLTLVGANNVNINWYFAPNGTTTGHQCKALRYLAVKGYWQQDANGQTEYITVVEADQSLGGTASGDGTAWTAFQLNTHDIFRKLKCEADCDWSIFSGCDCYNNMSWEGLKLDLKMVVTVNIHNWCNSSDGTNYSNALCYNYMGDYIQTYGVDTDTTNAMQSYCQNKYPNDSLSIFNSVCTLPGGDCQVCACNMAQDNYDQFYQSLEDQEQIDKGSLRSNCMLPACAGSIFKGIGLDGCPGPACINTVVVDDTNNAGNINIAQNATCITNTNTGSSSGDDPDANTTSTTTTTNLPPDPNAVVVADGDTGLSWSTILFWSMVVFVIICVIVVVLLIVRHKKSQADFSGGGIMVDSLSSDCFREYV